MLSLFLGAGFSKWSVGLPVANQLFDFEISTWPKEKEKINIVKSLKFNWDSKHPNSTAEEFISDVLKLDEEKKQAVLWYIGRRLSEPFIWEEFRAQKRRRHVLMIDENYKNNIQGINNAQDFLKDLTFRGLAGVITTNYDLVLEYALGTKGFNYGTYNQIIAGRGPYPLSQWKNPVRLSGDLPVAKIHGSISWDINQKFTDGRRGITGNALIVAPTPEKNPPEALESTWQLAETILQKSKSLIIFGFAFNPYDVAVINLLKNYTYNIENILIVDIEPKLYKAKELWPRARISECLPPIDGNTRIKKWLEELQY